MPILLVFAMLVAGQQVFASTPNTQITCNKANDICLVLPNESEVTQHSASIEARSMLFISDIIPDEYALKDLRQSFQNETLNNFKNKGLPEQNIKAALSIDQINNYYLRTIRPTGKRPALIPVIGVSKTDRN